MAQSKQEIQTVLATAGTQPKHRFGQNFMIDQNLVRLIADAGRIEPGDTVIEVGPGTGTLTEELLSRGARVVAVEIDTDLCAALRQRFIETDRFVLIQGDALAGKHELNGQLLDAVKESGIGKENGAGPTSVKLVANLPYNIASPLVIELLLAGVGLLAFTVQKEVADRLAASAGSDDYGPLSVMAQLLGRVEMLRTLPPQAFWPAPKVDSALVRITTPFPGHLGEGRGADSHQIAGHPMPAKDFIEQSPVQGHRERELGRFVHAVFSYRRKTLRKALAEAGHDPSKILLATGFDGTLRPEQFTPKQFAAMFAARG